MRSNWLAATIFELATSLPMPVESAHIFEASHLFISEFSYDFEHLSTIAVHSENLVAEQVLLEEDLL